MNLTILGGKCKFKVLLKVAKFFLNAAIGTDFSAKSDYSQKSAPKVNSCITSSLWWSPPFLSVMLQHEICCRQCLEYINCDFL